MHLKAVQLKYHRIEFRKKFSYFFAWQALFHNLCLNRAIQAKTTLRERINFFFF